MNHTLYLLFMRYLATTLMVILFAVGCETSEPECDGDGKNNGCSTGEYCGSNNICQQDCTADSECDRGEECTDNGKCISCEDQS